MHIGTLLSLQHVISFLQVTGVNWLKCKEQVRNLAFKLDELINRWEKKKVVNMSQVA